MKSFFYVKIFLKCIFLPKVDTIRMEVLKMNNLKRTKIFGKKEKINLFVFIGIAIALGLVIYFSNSSFETKYTEGNKNQIADNSKFNEELNVNESNIDNALQVNNIPSGTNVKNKDVSNDLNNQEVKNIEDKNYVSNKSDSLDKSSNSDVTKTSNEDKKDLVNKDVADVDSDNSDTKVSATTVTFSLPVEGTLIREYSVDTVYSKTLNTWRTRDGIDLKADKGSSVMSVLDGVVEKIDNDLTERGQYIVIKHDNGFKSVYTNLDEGIKVVNGQNVRKGEVIATVGNSSGNYSNEDYGAHLNFVMYLNNEEVNPADYINFK